MKVFQYLTAIFLCCLFSVCSFAQSSYKVTAAKVNVRNKPSSQALVVGVVSKDEIIAVSEVNNGWATISFKGKTRYIDAQYIEPVEKPVTTEKPDVVKPSKPKGEEVESSSTPTPSKLSDFKKQKGKTEKKVAVKKVKENKTTTSSSGNMHLIVDAFGGYSNFMCDEVTPEFGVGFGADIGLQVDYSRLWGKLPQGLFGEVNVGYAYRGSGAFPVHYVEARVLPIGYRHKLNASFNIVGKVGGYIAYPFSDIETQYDSYSTCLDFGISAGLGVEWKQFGVMATYEHGFADVTDNGRVELFNQGAFLTISYKIRTF